MPFSIRQLFSRNKSGKPHKMFQHQEVSYFNKSFSGNTTTEPDEDVFTVLRAQITSDSQVVFLNDNDLKTPSKMDTKVDDTDSFEVNELPTLEEEFESNPNYLHVPTLIKSQPNIGVLSDSEDSACSVGNQLTAAHISMQYFKFPEAMESAPNEVFDRIPAWIICLSEENHDVFLDEFLDRYIDIPTLFIFDNATSFGTQAKLRSFLEGCSLQQKRVLN